MGLEPACRDELGGTHRHCCTHESLHQGLSGGLDLGGLKSQVLSGPTTAQT